MPTPSHSSSWCLLSSITSWMIFSAALSAFSGLSLTSPYLAPLQQPAWPHLWATIMPQELRR